MAEFSQDTWDLVEARARALFRPGHNVTGLHKFIQLLDVQVTNASAELGGGRAVEEPATETLVLRLVNPGNLPQKWSQTVSKTKKQTASVTMVKTVSSTTTVSVDASADFFGIKSSVKYSDVETVSLVDTNVQTFDFSEVDNKTLNYDIPPFTFLLVRIELNQTQEIRTLSGTGTIDALFRGHYSNAPFGSLSVSDRKLSDAMFYSPPPAPRTISMEGVAVLVKSSEVNVVFDTAEIPKDHPLLKLADDDLEKMYGYKRDTENTSILVQSTTSRSGNQ